jgi:hypothetical protein
MVFPARNRYTFSGIFGTVAAPVEIWSISLSTGPEVFADKAGREARALAAKNVWSTKVNPHMRTTTILTRVRVAQLLEGNKGSTDANGAYNQGDWVGSQVGGTASATQVPLQTAMAVSLHSARAGATGKGRFFLPWPAFAIESDFRLAVASQTTLNTAMKDFLDGLNALVVAPGVQDDIVVASSKGYVSRVIQVSVGRVPDTMRSRRSALLEQPVLASLIVQ